MIKFPMIPLKSTPLFGVCLAVALQPAMGQTWNQTAAGTYDWNDNANWATTPFPNAIGASADLRANLTGDQIINLNQAITVGTLRLGDPTSTYHGITIAPNGGSLTFQVSSGSALLEKLTVAGASAVLDTISANITLNSNWNVAVGQSTDPGNNNPTAHAVTISGDISGAGRTLTKSRSGTLNLNGDTTLGSVLVGVEVSANRGGQIAVGSGGTFSVGAGTSDLFRVGGSSGNGYGFGTFNASASSSFTANVGTFSVGFGTRGNGDNQSGGTLNLGADNSITATTVIFGEATAANGAGGLRTITTANNGTTTINTGSMNLAIGGVATSSFTLGTDASLLLRGQAGEGTRTSLRIGDNNVGWGSGGGNMNLSAGEAQLYLTQLVVGKTTNSGNVANSQLSFSANSANHLDINAASGNAVQIGFSSSANNATGTVTIGHLNSTSTIATSDASAAAILIGYKGAGGAATGTLSLNGGTLNLTTGGGAAIEGGGGTSTLNLAGGARLVAGENNSDWITGLTAANLNTGGATIDTNGFDLGVSQGFSGTGDLTIDGAGTLTLSGTSDHTGATFVSAGTLLVTGELGNTAVTVSANGTIGGNGGTLGGSIDFEAGAKLDLTGATLDLISAGILTVAGGQSMTFNDFQFADIVGWDWLNAAAGTYTLIAGGGDVTLGGNTPTISNPYDFGNGRIGYFQEGSFQAVIIPEPTTALLGGLGMLMLLRRRRA